MAVVPFRSKKPAPPEQQEPSRCPRCGWLIPTSVRADRRTVLEPITLYIDCPECGASLILLVESL